MERPRFKTMWNSDAFPHTGEVNTLPSMTVPDQSLSVKEILYRFQEGLPLDNIRRGEQYDEPEAAAYSGNFDGDDSFDVHPANALGYDLTELDDMRRESKRVMTYAAEVSKKRKEALQRAKNATTTNDDAK